MTKQPKHDSFNLSPSLQAKLRAFADGLVPEEAAQLRSIWSGEVAGQLMPSLQEKAQQTAAALTSEEEAELHALLHDVDVRGYKANLYDFNPLDPYTGRPDPDKQVTGGGAGLVAGGLDRYSAAFLAVVILGTV